MDCFASLAMTGKLRDAGELQNKQRQLINRIGDFEADQNQRCDHQIKTEMHEKLETKYFAACAARAEDASQIQSISDTPASDATTEQLERGASAAAEASRLLTRPVRCPGKS